jgi:tRNA G18 (ribose-2'-O)-methylase SpoU
VAVIDIDDPSDNRLDDYLSLGDPELARQRCVFIAEGRLVVARVLEQGGFDIRSLLLNDAARRALGSLLARVDPAVPVYVCRSGMFTAITGFNIHRGCLAIVERPRLRSLDEVLDGASMIVALDGVTNADNVGGVFRCAAAFGVDAVVLSETTCDPLYRKAIRTSMATSLRVPYTRAAHWSDAVTALHDRGFCVVALTPASSAEALDDFAVRPRPGKLALIVGAEGDGLGTESTAGADYQVRIPTRPEVDSLNLAVATGIALSRLTGGERLRSHSVTNR